MMMRPPPVVLQVKELAAGGLKFQAGTKLEAIDPLNLCTICVATVMKVCLAGRDRPNHFGNYIS